MLITGVRLVGSGGRLVTTAAAEMSGRRIDPTRDMTGGSADPVDRREIEDVMEILCRRDLSVGSADRRGVAVGLGVAIDESVMFRVELKSSFVSVASMLLRICRRFCEKEERNVLLLNLFSNLNITTMTTRSLSLIVSIWNCSGSAFGLDVNTSLFRLTNAVEFSA